jgi:hypothetical protein
MPVVNTLLCDVSACSVAEGSLEELRGKAKAAIEARIDVATLGVAPIVHACCCRCCYYPVGSCFSSRFTKAKSG